MRPAHELSNSRMNILAACPYSYWRRYLLGEGDYHSEPAAAGKLAHAIFAAYIASLARRKRSRDFDALIEIAEPMIESAIACGQLPEHRRQKMERVVQLFGSAFTLEKKADRHMVEKVLAVTRDWQPMVEGQDYIYDHDKHCIADLKADATTGILDYLAVTHGKSGQHLYVADWKSGEEHVQPGDAHNSAQLLLYAAMALTHFPEAYECTVFLHGVAYGARNKDAYTWRRETALDYARERTETAFLTLDHYHERQVYPANSFSQTVCQYCSCAASCPIVAEVLPAIMEMEELPPLRGKRSATPSRGVKVAVTTNRHKISSRRRR